MIARQQFANLKNNKEPLVIDKHMTKILELLNDEFEINDKSYPFLIIEYLPEEPQSKIVCPPYKNRVDGHAAVSFQCAGYFFQTFVSSPNHKKPDIILDQFVTKSGNLRMAREKYTETPAFQNTLPYFEKIVEKYGSSIPDNFR